MTRQPHLNNVVMCTPITGNVVICLLLRAIGKITGKVQIYCLENINYNTIHIVFRYCSEHALKTALTRNRRAPPPRTAEVLLSSISHYVSNKRSRTSSSGSSHPSEEYFQTTEENDLGCTKSMDPFGKVRYFDIYFYLMDIVFSRG